MCEGVVAALAERRPSKSNSISECPTGGADAVSDRAYSLSHPMERIISGFFSIAFLVSTARSGANSE